MKETENEVPFFARFLEGQEFPHVKANLKAGRTLKFPSDLDEGDQTMKYPSDDDEGTSV
jgi:Serine endopeptidase inhibitors